MQFPQLNLEYFYFLNKIKVLVLHYNQQHLGNAQILILFLHVTNGTNLNSILDKSGIGTDLSNIRNHMDVLSLPAHLSIWLGGPETGLHKIDNQTQEAHNIIITKYIRKAISRKYNYLNYLKRQ